MDNYLRQQRLANTIDQMCREQIKEFEESEREKKRLEEEKRLQEEKLAKTKEDLKKPNNNFKDFNPFF